MPDIRPAAEDRDRDEAGKARNARPRDGLGRPLAHGEVGVPRLPEGVVRTPAQTITLAQQLLDDGSPFQAHEVFEDAWKSAADDFRPLWKGLAQLAVGITHAARGNPAGAVALLERGASTIAAFDSDKPYGIDVAQLHSWALAGAAELREATTDAAVTLHPLRLSH